MAFPAARWAVAVAQTEPSFSLAPGHETLPGAVGLIWDYMGFNGRQWIIKDFNRTSTERSGPATKNAF